MSITAVALAATAAPATATPGDGLLDILAMGDSYTAGNGGGEYQKPKRPCYRSTRNYANTFERLVERPATNRVHVHTIACSGDTTDEIFNSKRHRDPQIDAVDARYDLITMTIGGNDLHFPTIVEHCFLPLVRAARACAKQLSTAERLLAEGIMRARLASVLREIRAKAHPAATIVLLGYPYLERDPKYTLGHGQNAVRVGRRVRALEDVGDLEQQAAIVDVNDDPTPGPRVMFLNTKRLFAGHELAARHRNPKRWFVAPQIGVDQNTWYHPNPTGWEHEAEFLLADPFIPERDPNPLAPVAQ